MSYLLLWPLAVLLLYLSSPGPDFGWLAWLAFIPILAICRRINPRQAFWQGLLSFTCYHLLTLYWVIISMERYGHLPWSVSWAALFLLALYMSFYPAAFCWLIARLSHRLQLIWLAPMFWVTTEYLRSFLFTGFPWLDIGYSQYHFLPIIQCVDLGGHQLLSFIIIQANVLLYLLTFSPATLRRTPWSSGLALLTILGCLGYGLLRLPQIQAKSLKAPTITTTIIQANIDQSVKWLPAAKENSINQYIALTNAAQGQKKADLIIWPETALPIFPTLDPLMDTVIQRTVATHNYALLSGAPFIIGNRTRYNLYNSALLLGPDGDYSHYFKRHLVPFGEYIPFRGILPLPGPIVNSISDFSAGQSATPLPLGTNKIGMLICVEAIYPDLTRRSTKAGATMLANITNDAWFGRSSAPRQHLVMTIFRAVENRRALARAANTGYSAFIMPSGRLLQQTDLFTPSYITMPLPVLSTMTIFTLFGHFFPMLCGLATIIMIIPRPPRANRD